MTIRRTAGRRTAGSEWPDLPVWGNRLAALSQERGQLLYIGDGPSARIKARYKKGVEPEGSFT